MAESANQYFCQKCGKNLQPDQRPCPTCGNSHLLIKVHFTEGRKTRIGLKSRHIRPGIKSFLSEQVQGWFLSGDTAKHPAGIEKLRFINKRNPSDPESYQEKITDVHTGKIVRDVKEPLNRHFKKN